MSIARLRLAARRPTRSGRPGSGQLARRLAVATLLAAAAGPASAATCRLQGAGQWGPIGTWTGADDCGGWLTPGDRFIVEGEAEVVADLVQSPFGSTYITVAPGGSLRIAAGSGPRRIELGPLGLHCQAGSVCDVQGGFRAPRADGSIQAGDVVADFAGETLWLFGRPIPCPGWDDSQAIWQPDCAGTLTDPGDRPGSNTVLGGHFAHPLDAELETALDAVQPGEVWYFLDPDPTDVDAPREAGFHYDVVAAQGGDVTGGPTGGFVHLDVRQGSYDNGYAQSRRTLLACELAAPVAARSREIHVRADCFGADFERDGHWLRFESNGVAFGACPGTAAAPCEAESRAWRIQASEDDVACPGGGSCDRLTLADVRGLDAARSAGGIVWINQVGAGEADAGVMMVPVRIGSATAAVDETTEADSEIDFAGELHVRGAVFDQVGRLWIGGNGFRFGRFEDVFLREPTSDGQTPLLFIDAGEAVTLRRVSLIGGEGFGREGTGGGGDDHGICFIDPLRRLDAILEDVSVRYAWDDLIVTGSGDPPRSLTARRVRVQFEGHTIQSQSGLQVQNPDTAAYVEDFECVDCADDERPISLVGTPPGSVRRVLFLSPKSDVTISVDGPVEDVTAIGARDAVGGALAGRRLHRCVLRENRSTSTAGLVSGNGVDLSQCLIRGNAVPLDLISSGTGETTLFVRDSAILDNTETDGGGGDLIDCRNVSGPGGRCVVERATLGYSPGRQADPNRFATGVTAAGGADGRELRISENVHFGLTLGFWTSGASEATLERLCFEQNASDAPASHLAWVAQPVYGALDLRSPMRGAFDPLPDGKADRHPCGVTPDAPAGVCRRLWVHAINGLEPECLAPACANGADDDFDGLRDHPEDPGCTSPDDDDEDPPACANGIDDDGDGLVDRDDPGCPPGASGPEDPPCDDRVDNDGDGLVDFGDPNCKPKLVDREKARACGLGAEAALLAPLGWLRGRRRARGTARPARGRPAGHTRAS